MYYEPYDIPLVDYEKYMGTREYWDDFGNEWSWSPIEQKIIRLAGFVQQGGNLKKVINHYAKGRDAEYRERIQYCIMYCILKLMTGDLVHIDSDVPFVDRIKRLTKEELVKLLSDQRQLKHHTIYYSMVYFNCQLYCFPIIISSSPLASPKKKGFLADHYPSPSLDFGEVWSIEKLPSCGD